MGEDALHIREFRETDTDIIATLWKTTFPNDPPWNEPIEIIRRKQLVQSELFLVGLIYKRVIATVLGGYDGFRGWVYHLAVDPEYRGQGIGKKMMAAIEQKLMSLNCPKINLQIRSHNIDVINFYKNIGYDIEDHTSMGKILNNEINDRI